MTTRRYWLVFLTVGSIAGFVFWWQADWWAYVEFPEGPMPKFEFPWWVQLPVSVMFGCVCGVIGIVVAFLVGWVWRRR